MDGFWWITWVRTLFLSGECDWLFGLMGKYAAEYFHDIFGTVREVIEITSVKNISSFSKNP